MTVLDLEEQFKRRVDEGKVARILLSIATTPQPAGKARFDGGAARNVTGWTQYEFTDGTRARVDVVPGLHVVIQFPNGYGAVVSQLNPEFDIGFLKPRSQQP